MSDTPLIQLSRVKKSYYLSTGEEIPVLKGVDLQINKGEFVALMGESGGGKSTLLNSIGCLHFLSEGSYILEGEDISSVRDDSTLAFIRNKKMGFIFQSFHLIGKLNAVQNVSLPGFYAGISQKKREEKAKKILESVGLADRIFHKPSELSGGQQQRVSIARALMNDPEILLADEPTGALDSKTGKEVIEIFLNLKQQKKTIIMVTHTPAVARFADRIIFLRDGLVVDQDFQLEKQSKK